MKNLSILFLSLTLTLSTSCDNKPAPRVHVEQAAPPKQDFNIPDTNSGVVDAGPLTPTDSMVSEDPYPEQASKPTLPDPEPTPIKPTPPAPAPPVRENPTTPTTPTKPGKPTEPTTKPPTKGIYTNPDRLERNLAAASNGDPVMAKAQQNALKSGNDALQEPILVIATKTYMVDAKDPHDFNSVAPYWHWDSKCKCWKRIDGKGNGLSAKIGDTHKLQKGIGTVIPKLARAYVAATNPLQKEKYAGRAVEYCTAFFLNPKTKMNANLNFAQVIPGQKQIRVETAVEGEKLVDIVDALSLLQGSKAYTPEFDKGIKAWFSEMANWMANSPTGKEADKKAIGNIGVIYETMRTSFAVFGGDDTYAARRFPRIQARLFDELNSQNMFWREAERHKANMYTNKAMQAWTELFRVMAMQGQDVWTMEKNGESFEKAVVKFTPYMLQKPGYVLAKGEKIQPNYFLRVARTAQYVYRGHPETVRVLEEFLAKHDKAFRAGQDPDILTEPYLPWKTVATLKPGQKN